MLQGFLNETAISEIEKGQFIDPLIKILQESIQTLDINTINEGIGVEDVKQKVLAIIEKIRQFMAKIANAVRSKLTTGKNIVDDIHKNEKLVNVNEAPKNTKPELLRLEEPGKNSLPPFLINGMMWGTAETVVWEQKFYENLFKNLKSVSGSLKANGKLDMGDNPNRLVAYPFQGQFTKDIESFKKDILKRRIQTEYRVTSADIPLLERVFKNTLNALELVEKTNNRYLAELKGMSEQVTDSQFIPFLNKAAECMMTYYHAVIEIFTIKYNDYLRVLSGYNNYLVKHAKSPVKEDK